MLYFFVDDLTKLGIDVANFTDYEILHTKILVNIYILLFIILIFSIVFRVVIRFRG